MEDPITSTRVLRERQYAGPENLAARQTLWTYGTSPAAHAATRLDALRLAGTETVLDVGCGNGIYLHELRRRQHTGGLLGVDLSPGMARAATAASGAPVAVAHAARLPVATGAVDAALSMHMLYHVPDPSAAIAELRRAVRPGGALLASTNGSRHAQEVITLINDAARAVTGRQRRDGRFSFTLETGATWLTGPFGEVAGHETVETVPVPHAEPVIAYVASFGPEHAGVSTSAQWDAFLATAADLVHARIARDGEFRVTSHTGFFVCR